MARLVFLGRMLPGASTELGRRQVLGSPATVRVLRYLKGSGPRRVKVTTAATITNRGVTVAEDGIEPQVGEISDNLRRLAPPADRHLDLRRKQEGQLGD